jgi:hypothetical protein
MRHRAVAMTCCPEPLRPGRIVQIEVIADPAFRQLDLAVLRD